MNGSEAKQKVGQLSDQPPPASRLFVSYQALCTTSGPTQLHQQTISTDKKELTNLKKGSDRF